MKRVIFITLLMSCVAAWGQRVEQPASCVVDGCTLYGTLMLPSDSIQQPLVVALLVGGSGPTDRDGNAMLMQNNSLRMIAQSLAHYGIASLRYDKRGIAASRYSAFDQSKMSLEIYASDVVRWIKQLNEDRRFSRVVLIGHSEGALLSMMAVNGGAHVSQLVSLAGAGRPLDVVIKEQLAPQSSQIKQIAFKIIDSLRNGHTCSDVPLFLNSLFPQAVQPFLISAFRNNPSVLATRITIPMLVVQGNTDIQIKLTDAIALCSANENAEMVVVKGMNHPLKECTDISREAQFSTYSNPTLPLHKELMAPIVKFITSYVPNR